MAVVVFLMYRVELKGLPFLSLPLPSKGFLMYRVELKGNSKHELAKFCFQKVPNVPCGVERGIIIAEIRLKSKSS